MAYKTIPAVKAKRTVMKAVEEEYVAEPAKEIEVGPGYVQLWDRNQYGDKGGPMWVDNRGSVDGKRYPALRDLPDKTNVCGYGANKDLPVPYFAELFVPAGVPVATAIAVFNDLVQMKA